MAVDEDLMGLADFRDLEIVKPRNYRAWIASAVILVFVAMLANMLITNERFEWDIVWDYIFEPIVLRGVRLTLILTFVSMLIGVVLGLVLATFQTSKSPILRRVSGSYLWLFRGSPLLVQLIFWFNLAALIPEISLGVPFGPTFATWDTNDLITPTMAALLGLGLNEGGYMTDVMRSGLLSVDEGQTEAAKALGMRPQLVLRRIVLPQAMRVIIPPTGGRTIQMLKTSSLVSVLAIPELLQTVQTIYSRSFKTIPLLIVATIWYLFFTSVLTALQRRLEDHYGRGHSRHMAS